MSSTTVKEVNEPAGEFTSHDTPPKRSAWRSSSSVPHSS